LKYEIWHIFSSSNDGIRKYMLQEQKHLIPQISKAVISGGGGGGGGEGGGGRGGRIYIN
jgi:hypothetical protein